MILSERALDSLFLGVYWQQRQESRAACAARLSAFLRDIRTVSISFETWFLKAKRKELALTRADISIDGIEALLRTNNRDVSGDPVRQLGFRIGLWNGKNISFSATVGAFSPFVANAVLLSYQRECPSDVASWRTLLEKALASFDPDSGVVTNQDYVSRHGDGTPDEAGGWLTYKRGGAIEEHVFP